MAGSWQETAEQITPPLASAAFASRPAVDHVVSRSSAHTVITTERADDVVSRRPKDDV